MVLEWNLEHAKMYAVLANNKESHEQFEQAIDVGDHEKACSCLSPVIVHTATNFRMGMSKNTSVCAPLQAGRIGSHYPP
eukprot:80582-Pelagomonas_calceolata.AAC.3